MSKPAMRHWMLPPLLLATAFALSACKEDVADAALPEPQILTEEAAGHYCQMVILEHDGPKAQAYIAGYEQPFWFSQVRDGLAFLKSPEQLGEIIVIYVNDMGAAISWSEPGDTNWITARDAVYVVGSDARGGMGAPELVPFSSPEAAAEFASEHGGEVMRLDDIPIEAVLAPIDFLDNEVEDPDDNA